MKSRLVAIAIAIAFHSNGTFAQTPLSSPNSEQSRREYSATTESCVQSAYRASQKVELNLDMIRAMMLKDAKEQSKADPKAMAAFDQKAQAVQAANKQTIQRLVKALESTKQSEQGAKNFVSACNAGIREIAERSAFTEQLLASRSALPPPTVK